jgi:hypothetical protein
MTPQEIIEGNQLLAEFMGYVNTTPTDPDFNIYENSSGEMLEAMSVKYHSSWDWLMEVVEKIESLGFYFNIKKNHVVVARDNKDTRDNEMIHSEWGDQSKIERVFQCAVAFVKYCNQNKPV